MLLQGTLAVIPGLRASEEAGSHDHDIGHGKLIGPPFLAVAPWSWLPGSGLAACPGLTARLPIAGASSC